MQEIWPKCSKLRGLGEPTVVFFSGVNWAQIAYPWVADLTVKRGESCVAGAGCSLAEVARNVE